MTTLRDVILPGVPRNLFGWFLEHPYERPMPPPSAMRRPPAVGAVAGMGDFAPPDGGLPIDIEGLVEPGENDFFGPGMDDFAAPATEPTWDRNQFAPSPSSVEDLDDFVGVEALGHPTLTPEAYAGEVARFGEELGAGDTGPTLASWLSSIRDRLRSRPWFRILCELRLMAAERRWRKEDRRALLEAAKGAVAARGVGDAELASALRELAQVLRTQRREPSYAPVSWGPPPMPRRAGPPTFVPAPPAPVAPAAAPQPAPVVVVVGANAPPAAPAPAPVVPAAVPPSPVVSETPVVGEIDEFLEGECAPEVLVVPPPAAPEFKPAPAVEPPKAKTVVEKRAREAGIPTETVLRRMQDGGMTLDEATSTASVPAPKAEPEAEGEKATG